MQQGDRFFGTVPRIPPPPVNSYLFCQACGGELHTSGRLPDTQRNNVSPNCEKCGEVSNHRSLLLQSSGIATVHCGWKDEGPAAESLRLWKATPGNEADCIGAGRRLGQMLLRICEESLSVDCACCCGNVLVPMPGWWGGRLSRGFDPPQRLAEGISEILGWPVCSVLVRVNGSRMAGKTRTERKKSSRELFRTCFRGHCKVPDRSNLWLVDDLLATGATSSAAARLLRRIPPAALHLIVANVRN